MLDGSKMWCSYAHKASEILIVCRTGAGERHEDLSMIFVPRDAEGLTITPIKTLGGEETNELHLDGVRVPEEALLGAAGGGWMQLMAGLNYERVILAASALGLAQRSFDDALAYAKERKQFGRPIGSFQAISHKFAELATEIAQVRLLVRWVARADRRGPGRMLPQEASMAKLAATELAKRMRARGHPDHGRLRVRHGVPDGAPPARRRGHHDLRRHVGDPEEHHREDARAVAVLRGGGRGVYRGWVGRGGTDVGA